MNLKSRIEVLARLGDHLRKKDEYLEALMHRASFKNAWFTIENQKEAVAAIADNLLRREKLETWLQRYEIPEETAPKTVGIVMAGNIPLVGFHDLLCVFAAGHRALVKLSEKDQYLLPYLLQLMAGFDKRAEAYFSIAEQLGGFDAVIATGSNNSARYFEAYFGKYPHIIRRNRNGVAVLSGEESPEELHELGKDVFQYFGLGCRNVSKAYVPVNYDFEPLLEALHEYRQAVLHTRYKNNFDYNYALHVLNKEKFKANGCIILREDPSLQSRIASLHYEFYDNPEEIERELENRSEEIQCVVARKGFLRRPVFPFGKAQQPELWDYPDGVDTMNFLLKL
ncbi:MAG: acyl-CoA reductase [Lewinellaceae bacterium]|nr:acyl-CoA reductase [Lewinellaceae bacterium]